MHCRHDLFLDRRAVVTTREQVLQQRLRAVLAKPGRELDEQLLGVRRQPGGANVVLHRVGVDDLEAIQRRRTYPTRMTQGMQVFMQNHFISNVLRSSGPLPLPTAVKLLRRWPQLQRIPARVIGLGFRPEHVKTPSAPMT